MTRPAIPSLARLLAAASLCGASLLAVPAAAATKVGEAEVAVRRVSGVLAGETRTVRVGSGVFQDETISTEPEGNARLLLLDQTSLSIGSSAAVTLDRFVYAPNGTARSAVLTAARGVVRWVSGRSPSGAYQVKTPHASLGIRGTSFDLLVSRTETTIVLLSGAVTVCPRQGQGRCAALDRPGAVAVASRSGVQGPGSARARAVDLPLAYRQLGGSFLDLVGTAAAPTLQGITGLPGVGDLRDARDLRDLPGRLPAAAGALSGAGDPPGVFGVPGVGAGAPALPGLAGGGGGGAPSGLPSGLPSGGASAPALPNLDLGRR